MDTAARQALLNKYAAAMAYIAVTNNDQSHSIGSAFHVGEGVFVTARHVVDGNYIEELKLSEFLRVPLQDAIPEYTDDLITWITDVAGSPPTWPLSLAPLEISNGPHFHPDDNIDIAVFKVSEVHPKLPFVPLGGHLDDWIFRAEWRLSEAIILGYPPIPMTSGPSLIAARAEINAVTWPRAQSKAGFILSATPRGGFSGGLALHENDFVLGVITQSLIEGGQPSELGFLAVVSIEPIYECLAKAKILPECQKEPWGDFWNTTSADFVTKGGLMVASVHVHDDGMRFYIEVRCDDSAHFGIAKKAVLEQLIDSEVEIEEEQKRAGWVRINVFAELKLAVKAVHQAGRAAEGALRKAGLNQMRRLPTSD